MAKNCNGKNASIIGGFIKTPIKQRIKARPEVLTSYSYSFHFIHHGSSFQILSESFLTSKTNSKKSVFE